ncbi:MAG: VRR-NUC domain-containing protein [Glaciimonas sp.]|nr:VRR-NUC domain-containing protein [Glaciimonas sp.]
MVDLFGDDLPPAVRTNARPEAAALLEVLKTLRAHSSVAWCERMNSGAAKIDGRFIRFGWTGCPDVIGQLNDGRLLGVEVKAPKGKLRPEQVIFLERIRCAGGVAFMARDCRDVLRELAASRGTGRGANECVLLTCYGTSKTSGAR